MGKLKIAFIPIARKTFDIEFADQVTKAARDHLLGADLNLIGPEELITNLEQAKAVINELEDQSFDLAVIFQATFADSTMLMAQIGRASCRERV